MINNNNKIGHQKDITNWDCYILCIATHMVSGCRIISILKQMEVTIFDNLRKKLEAASLQCAISSFWQNIQFRWLLIYPYS